MIHGNLNINGAKRRAAFPTAGLQVIVYNDTYEEEGTTYLRTSLGIGLPVISGTGLDAIYDFSVLNDARFDKSNAAYFGNDFYTGIYYDAENSYYCKFTDFARKKWELQNVVNKNFAFLKGNYDDVLNFEPNTLYIYSTELTGNNLIKIIRHIEYEEDYIYTNLDVNENTEISGANILSLIDDSGLDFSFDKVTVSPLLQTGLNNLQVAKFSASAGEKMKNTNFRLQQNLEVFIILKIINGQTSPPDQRIIYWKQNDNILQHRPGTFIIDGNNRPNFSIPQLEDEWFCLYVKKSGDDWYINGNRTDDNTTYIASNNTEPMYLFGAALNGYELLGELALFKIFNKIYEDNFTINVSRELEKKYKIPITPYIEYEDAETIVGSLTGGYVDSNFTYSSSIDGIDNLYAVTSYVAGFTANLPIVCLGHGIGGDADTITLSQMHTYANQGFFVLNIGMRGRNGADGQQDASGRELYDVYDAINYVRNNYAFVSQTKVAWVGFSGGGGNGMNIGCKFPDLCNVIVSHWGMSDYGEDEDTGWYQNAPSYQSLLDSWIGSPTTNINKYKARNARRTLHKNFIGGKIRFYHGITDTIVLPEQSQLMYDNFDADNRYNKFIDIGSYSHTNYDGTTLSEFNNEIKKYSAWKIPKVGSLEILGFVKTKRFEIQLGNLDDHVADLEYDINAKTFTITPLTGEVEVTVIFGTTKTQTISEQTIFDFK